MALTERHSRDIHNAIAEPRGTTPLVSRHSLSRTTTSEIIEEARASLRNPTRPYTPAHGTRDRRKNFILQPTVHISHEDYSRHGKSHPKRGTLPGRGFHHLTPLPRRLTPLLSHTDLSVRAPQTESHSHNTHLADRAVKEVSHDYSSAMYSPEDESGARLQYFPTPNPSPIPTPPPRSTLQTPSAPAAHATMEDDDLLWNVTVRCLQNMINSDDISLLPTHVNALRDALNSQGWLRGGSNKIKERWKREHVMQEIIQWMDVAPDSQVAIAGCPIVMKMTRNERVLRHACKLLFKLSQNEDNDASFASFHVFESLTQFIRGLSSRPACAKQYFAARCPLLLYAIGTLKNLTHCEASARAVSEVGGAKDLGRAAAVVLDLNIASLPDDTFLLAVQLLGQITTTLRNLASSHDGCRNFLSRISESNGAETIVEILMRMLHVKVGLCDSEDVMMNVCRTLSKLSLDQECLEYMSGPDNINAFLGLLVKYQSEKPLLVRICFILGNLTTTISAAHVHLRAGIPDLVSLLGLYMSVELVPDSDEEESDAVGGFSRGTKENEEVLIKLIRLLANIAVDLEAGEMIVEMMEIEDLVHLLSCKPVAEHQELTLNIVGAIANFTFYDFPRNCILRLRLDIAKDMIHLLLHPNPETVVEAGRVLANLSRYADVRTLMAERRGTEVLTVLLDHSDRDVVYQASGCLMNVLVSGTSTAGRPDPHAVIILQNDGMLKFMEVIQNAFEEDDFELAMVVGRTLHNLCISSQRRLMNSQDINQLQALVCGILEAEDCWDASEFKQEKVEFQEVMERLDSVVMDYLEHSHETPIPGTRAAGSGPGDVEVEEWDARSEARDESIDSDAAQGI
ncbi:armadillo-type protein [Powellomyces hirtus]|nr:armadillo-type protein [Powellomyces hirtus]